MDTTKQQPCGSSRPTTRENIDDDNDNCCKILEDLSFQQLSQLFEQVVVLVRDDSNNNDNSDDSSLVVSTSDKLLLYGWYKHATTATTKDEAAATAAAANGSTTTQPPPPPVWNVTAYAKYQAVEVCRRDLTRREAMQKYIVWCAAQQQHPIGQRVQAAIQQAVAAAAAAAVDEESIAATSSQDTNNCNNEKREGKVKDNAQHSLRHHKESLRQPPPTTTTNGIMSMIPRGQLDIGYRDLLYAAWQSCTAHNNSSSIHRRYYQERIAHLFGKTNEQQQQQDVIVGLSVRSLMDLWLRVQHYPAGSQIVVSPPITVPAVLRVLEYHQIDVVPIDLPAPTTSNDQNTKHRPVVAVDCDSVERAISNDPNNKVVAILVVHVFGMMTANDDEMQHLRTLADRHNILLMEDCAQVYGGGGNGSTSAAAASPYAHVSFYSFGLIKTCTSLGCGVAVVRDKPALAESMQRFQTACYPPQPAVRYRYQILKAFVLHVIADSPVIYGCIMALCEQGLGWNFDQLTAKLLRSFGNTATVDDARSMMDAIRYQPSTAMLAVLCRRLLRHEAVSSTISVRRERCRRFSEILSADHSALSVPQFHENHPLHAFWLYPVLSPNPSTLCAYLKSLGFDATCGASQLMCIGKEDCPKARELMEQVVYLPISSPALTNTKLSQLERALKAYSTNGPEFPFETSMRSTRTGHSNFDRTRLQTAVFFVGFLLIAAYAVSVVKILLFVATALAFTAVLVFLAAQGLRMSIASYYINSSNAFAKYNYMLDDSENRILADEGSIRSDPCVSFRLDSTMNILKLPDSTRNTPRSVILTGATGFIGSMLLHDLLKNREALALKYIYIICRSKRGRSSSSRVDDLLSKPMFSFISQAGQDSMVRVLDGDTTKPDLGVRDSELTDILQDQSITHIYHCAASVSFTQSLADAASANISSALYAQRLVSQLPNKNAQFVHISTAFVHGRLTGTQNEPLPEQLHSLAPYDARAIYRSMCGTQYYASKAMADLGFPNTYTFSKCVAEHLLQQSDARTVIIRPSIVGPALEKPFPGWSGSKPSTFVAAACLYFVYQWNLWSFGSHKVPCIPVDILCRFILSKTLKYDTDTPDEVLSGGNNDEISSSDDEFEKISRSSIQTFSSSGSDQAESLAYCKIHTAAWDASSETNTQFTWLDYASTITHTGAVMGYFSRTTAYLGLSIAVRLLPMISLSYHQFENLHIFFVQGPFDLLLKARRAMGLRTSRMERLRPCLDLPLLFFPFMNNAFHFSSELVAPAELQGQHYLFRCVSAAHIFLSKRGDSRYRNREALFLLDNNHRTAKGVWWASMQPKGNAITRIAALLLSYIFPLCFTNITIDAKSFCDVFRELQQLDGRSRIILAPTHRSFFDFLLLSYALFNFPELQFDIPFIVAADDFEKLPVIGYLARLLGAFFITRGRGQKDPLLTGAVEGIPSHAKIELFIEGTRSRDRRFLQPKTGFIRCLQAMGDDLSIVPVTISYEAIPEQQVLSHEAAVARSSGFGTSGLFSWLLNAAAGKLSRGRVHISAALPVRLIQDSQLAPSTILDRVQVQQKERLFISRYHVSALAAVLNLEEESVTDALLKLGCKFWPKNVPSEIPPIPVDKEEIWTVALQAGPWLSALFFNTQPQWSKWLFRLCNQNASDKIMEEPSVRMISRALGEQFNDAAQNVERAISELTQKGFVTLRCDHITQIARKYGNVPTILLRAAVAMALPQSPNTVSVADDGQFQIVSSLSSGEALGRWGFSDSFFAMEVDRDGNPYVTLKGSRYSLRDKHLSRIIPFIEQELEVQMDLLREAFRGCCSRRPTPTCRLSAEDIELLQTSMFKISFDPADRIRSGTGHSQEDVFEIRRGKSIRVPDAVVRPRTESEVQAIIALAKERNWCLIPVGGGTNVSQATRCPPLDVEPRPIVALDMKDMNRIIFLDEENGTAHVDAGITGRKLVEEMARRGYTIGHEPDSYEFSTLGGWIATKASGMKRNRYGNIEDIVRAVRVAGPNGILEHGSADSPVWGRESASLDLCSMMLGSEGCLGIIMSAVIRIWPVARARDYDSILLRDFEQGLNFARDIAKLRDKAPASVRLLDNAHFRLGRALQPNDESTISFARRAVGETLLRWSGYFDESQVVCATILYEGDPQEVRDQKRVLRRLAQHHGGLSLGAHVGQRGYDMTFMIAYLRDFALTYHIFGESFESFVPWSKVKDLVQATKNRIREEHSSRCLPGKAFVGCRITQLYHEGVCLYFYLSMSFDNVQNASTVFGEIEKAARDEILMHGGSLSHHHGVGKLRASFLGQIDSEPWQTTKLAVKRAVDPGNLFGARNGPFASYSTSSIALPIDRGLSPDDKALTSMLK